MKDLAKAYSWNGIILDKNKGMLILSHEKYIEKVLRSFKIEDSKLVTTPLTTQFILKILTKTAALMEAKRMERFHMRVL